MEKEKLKEIADYIGQNYGYNVEFSTEKQFEKQELLFIYKELYSKYGIDDLHLHSNYCETCFEYHKDKPYHFDAERVLDLENENIMSQIDKKYWSEEDIENEKQKMKEIKEAIKNLSKDKEADRRKELYTFYNQLKRTVEGMNGKFNFIIVNKEYYDDIMLMEDKEPKKYIKEWKARIDLQENLEVKYKLYEM